ncbi:MAG: class I SAM-dependent methyltransferase [Ginsengibacter sp.]
MKKGIDINIPNANEMCAATAFTQQAKIFDGLYSGNLIIQYKRKRVREHLIKYLSEGQFILELNSGTGEDALWMTQQNCKVHATDISIGMQQVLKKKIRTSQFEKLISYELCSFTELDKLQQRGPFDMIFSNFAGLNCTGDLKKVLESFSFLLRPRGVVTLVILPKFCLWESLLVFKGKFKTATRRFFSRTGRSANVEGANFKCWYYNPSYVIKYLKNDFDVLSIEGLCTLMPPSYIEYFAEKHPKMFSVLRKKEDVLKNYWPWKYIGDYYIISLQKKQ